MNKAFIKEIDASSDTRCPRCGSLGTPVFRQTLEAHLLPDGAAIFSDTALFCEYPPCEVAYFDHLQRIAEVSLLKHPVYPKSLDAPICGCFGYTIDQIELDVEEGTNRRVKEMWQRGNSPEACCSINSPNGQSCLPAIQRYFLKLREQRGLDA